MAPCPGAVAPSVLPAVLLALALAAPAPQESASAACAAEAPAKDVQDYVLLQRKMQSSKLEVPKLENLTLAATSKANASSLAAIVSDHTATAATAAHVAHAVAPAHPALAALQSGKLRVSKFAVSVAALCACLALGLLWLVARFSARGAVIARAVCLGATYIAVSAVMIESNKWLMQPDHFPYPFMLTANHMLVSFALANVLRIICPACFPALQSVKVTPSFCLKFLPIGVPFAVSLVCGNWAYKYLSVSFLQIMKQSNVATIYIFSAIVGLETLRRCSAVLLLGVLIGAAMAVQGELHFMLTGFLLQIASSFCEATKVIVQSVLMNGQAKLDPLTMVLFMAPACFLANLAPLAIVEGSKFGAIAEHLHGHWHFVLGNAVLAFVLNTVVAQCIKDLSAVGYLLCGIVKDICIVVTSAWFLGESLSGLQKLGFSLALLFVSLYSLYKQNLACFEDDSLIYGFKRVCGRTCTKRCDASPPPPQVQAPPKEPPGEQ